MSVFGRVCVKCGFDESANSFISGGVPLQSTPIYTFCNHCGAVYDTNENYDKQASVEFESLGRPGYSGIGKLEDPGNLEAW